jgi:hypothetical protein
VNAATIRGLIHIALGRQPIFGRRPLVGLKAHQQVTAEGAAPQATPRIAVEDVVVRAAGHGFSFTTH